MWDLTIGISFEPGTTGKGDEESRLEAKLKLLDLLSIESELLGA